MSTRFLDFLTPFSLVRIWNWFVLQNPHNFPYYVRFFMTSSPLGCGHLIWMSPNFRKGVRTTLTPINSNIPLCIREILGICPLVYARTTFWEKGYLSTFSEYLSSNVPKGLQYSEFQKLIMFTHSIIHSWVKTDGDEEMKQTLWELETLKVILKEERRDEETLG